ncbi:MAG: hypothetical protein JST84_04845 [Acidobacteria bacterium]|nr:hypothetical protein [Acidobacteriota bacterium]
MKINYTKSTVIGILLTALLLPVPVSAQWTVYDPVSNVNQIRQFMQDLNHWIETVQQYTQMYTNAVEQLTSMKGLLKNAEEMFAFDQKMRTTLSDLGQSVRLSFRIKAQLENLIVSQIRAFKNIRSRLRSGIFNPAQDAADFEEYLRYGIGRTSQDAINERERLLKMDNQYERLDYEGQQLQAQAADLAQQIEEKQAEIEKLRDCDTCTDKDLQLEKLSFDLQKMQGEHEELIKQATKLFDEKVKRAEEIYAQEDQRRVFGKDIQTLNKGWNDITRAKSWAREQISKMNNK